MIPTQIIETLPYPLAIYAENGPFQGDLPAAGFMSDHHTQQWHEGHPFYAPGRFGRYANPGDLTISDGDIMDDFLVICYII